MKLRITDGRSHAVEFEADNERQCRNAAIQAASEFSANTLLELHLWDGEAWTAVRRKNSSGIQVPVTIDQRRLFRGMSLWAEVERSYQQARTMIDGCRDMQTWLRRSFIEPVRTDK